MAKSFFEKIWWALPPILIWFIILPFLDYYWGWRGFHEFSYYLTHGYLKFLIAIFSNPLPWPIQLLFLGVGYYIVIKREMSGLLRIIVPVISWSIGFFINLLAGLMIAGA